MTDWADEIAEQLLDFWNWQAEKGLARDMQGNIASALRDARMADFRDTHTMKRPQIEPNEQSDDGMGPSLEMQ